MIVGLGNPGATYAGTRHNVGFDAIDALARAHGISLTNRRDRAATGRGAIADQAVILVKPQTFMNLSGDSVAAIALKEGIAPGDILVVTDDVYLPVGRIRLRASGSAGGQKGLAHILERLETQSVPRLRIGVGEALEGQRVDWVLSRFPLAERKIIDDVLISCCGAIETFLRDGIELAGTRFNGINPAAPPPKPNTVD